MGWSCNPLFDGQNSEFIDSRLGEGFSNQGSDLHLQAHHGELCLEAPATEGKKCRNGESPLVHWVGKALLFCIEDRSDQAMAILRLTPLHSREKQLQRACPLCIS
jgi:hypothetical protein